MALASSESRGRQGGNIVITCQACGTENADDAKYCTKCARKLDPETQEAVVQKRASYSATGLDLSKLVLTAVVTIVLVVVVIVLLVHIL